MFRTFKLSGKIMGVIAAVMIASSLVSIWITDRRVNLQTEEAFRDKVRQITGMASATRAWFSDNLDTMVPTHEFSSIKQAPVVVAWSVAERYAEANHMSFRTPSLRPRNPKNQPDDFERRALERFAQDPELKEFSERATVDDKEVMRYAQPVRLTSDCLRCHGDPAGGRDVFGNVKEGMKAGDLRGAFAVTASTEQMARDARANAMWLFLLNFLALTASMLGVWCAVRKLVVHPLRRSVELANAIADNNLAVPDLVVESGDELGEASAALNKMKNNLRAVVHQIASTAESVAAASEELSATAAEQSQAAETQRSQVAQVATAMHQMTTTVVEVSDNSNRAARVARESAVMATEGGTIVGSTLHTMNVINDAVGNTSRQIGELGKRSNEIGRIAGVIDEIADQTNLLALNAAIEAARAGEQGRGFAVVADEVRKLAERTTTATKEIAGMIEAIQAETRSAVEAMDAGTRQVREGVTATQKAGDALQQIIGKSQEVGDMITTIATAATEQSSTTEEVKNRMEEISRLVESSTIGTQQAAKACEDLSSLTHGLHNLVERFETGGTARHQSSHANAGGGASVHGEETFAPAAERGRWVQ